MGEQIASREGNNSGKTGWEELEGMGRDAGDTAGKDADGGMSERSRQLDEAVFESIDVLAVIERTMKAAERIDLKELSDVRNEMRSGSRFGLLKAEEYFTKILDLSLRPHILDVSEELGKTTLGNCSGDGINPDQISVNLALHKGDMDSVLETMAHENWHSYQNDVIRRVREIRKQGDEPPEELALLAELYLYNDKFYMKANLDYAGYRKQLVEVEAEAFRLLVKKRIDKIKDKEAKREEFFAAHPEVYGEENQLGIEREIDSVLHGLDIGEFLQKVGVESLDNLWDINENKEIVRGYTTALADLVGLEQPVEVKIEDELEDEKHALIDYKSHQIIISREQMRTMGPLSYLPEIVWKMRQRDIVRNYPESERGQMYHMNFETYIQDSELSHEAHKRQLLVRERDYFMQEWLSILDEQAIEEEIEMMSPEERLKVREEQIEADWEPVVSQKYDVKGRGINGSAN